MALLHPPTNTQLGLLVALNLALLLLLSIKRQPTQPLPVAVLQPRRQNAASHAPTTTTRSADTPWLYLITSAPATLPADRQHELVAAMRANMGLAEVRELHLLVDGVDDAQQSPLLLPPWLKLLQATAAQGASKLRVALLDAQPTFREIFAYANRHMPAGSIAMVMHSDVELAARSLQCVPRDTDFAAGRQPPILYALTRHPHPTCPHNSGGGARPGLPHNLCLDPWPGGAPGQPPRTVNSADAFVVRLPVDEAIVAQLNHLPNRRGAENRLVHFFLRAGYEVRNPCHAVRIYHRHCTARSSGDTSAIHVPRVDTNGATASIPRTRLECKLWNDGQ